MSAKGVRRLLLAGTAAFASIGSAQAQTSTNGTNAGTVINNTAQATYSVNGTPQTATSNTASFVVDRKVNLTVTTEQTSNTQVTVGQTGAVTTFRVTNKTNGTQDFLLSNSQTPILGLFAGDNFDMTNLQAYVDSNGNGTYEAGIDTAQYIDELAPDASKIVFLVGDVPNQSNAALAGVTLIATAAEGGSAGVQGAALQASLLNNDATVDVVFADNDSDGAGLDTANNGQGRASAAYEIAANNVAITVTKTSTVISDGVSLTAPKALPGAVVEYCLVVNNSRLLTAATNVVLTDVIPANTTYVPNSISTGVLSLGALTNCALNSTLLNDVGTAVLGTSTTATYNSTTRTMAATIPTLAGGTSTAVSFRVTIN